MSEEIKYYSGHIGLKKSSKNTWSIYIDENYHGIASRAKGDNLIVCLRGKPSEIEKIIVSQILHMV